MKLIYPKCDPGVFWLMPNGAALVSPALQF